jgi:hypothetical protein
MSPSPNTGNRRLTNERYDSPQTEENSYASFSSTPSTKELIPLASRSGNCHVTVTLSSLRMSKKKICKATIIISCALDGMVSFWTHQVRWYEHNVFPSC